MDEKNYVPPVDLTDTQAIEQDKQITLLARLQTLWLKHMEALLESGACTSTDLATLYRVLRDNGWQLDPTKLPKGLAEKLTKHVDPKSFEDEDTKVFPISKAM